MLIHAVDLPRTMCTKFGVDSSSRFSLSSADTHRHTDPHTETDTQNHPAHALVTRTVVRTYA